MYLLFINCSNTELNQNNKTSYPQLIFCLLYSLTMIQIYFQLPIYYLFSPIQIDFETILHSYKLYKINIQFLLLLFHNTINRISTKLIKISRRHYIFLILTPNNYLILKLLLTFKYYD